MFVEPFTVHQEPHSALILLRLFFLSLTGLTSGSESGLQSQMAYVSLMARASAS